MKPNEIKRLQKIAGIITENQNKIHPSWLGDEANEFDPNPRLGDFIPEIDLIIARLMEINETMEQEGPVDEDINDAIDSLLLVSEKLNGK